MILKMKNLMLVFFILLTVGCATTENYEKMLNTYTGFPESELIRNWGPPDSVYESGLSKYLTYSRKGSIFIPGTMPVYQTTLIGQTAYTNVYGGSPAMNIVTNCKTTFELVNGFVSNWRWEGNSCKKVGE